MRALRYTLASLMLVSLAGCLQILGDFQVDYCQAAVDRFHACMLEATQADCAAYNDCALTCLADASCDDIQANKVAKCIAACR